LTKWSQPSVPNRDNAVVNFGNVITSPQSVVVEDEVRAKTINFNSAHKYAVVGFDEVALIADTGSASINVTQGNHEFQVPVRLDSDTTVNVSAGSLSFNGPINLGGNTLTLSGAGAVNINNRVFYAGGGKLVNAGALAFAAGSSLDGDFSNQGDLGLMLASGGEPGLDIGGRALLAGTLSPQLAAGHGLNMGDVFVALSAGTLEDGGITLAGDLAGMFRMSFAEGNLLLTVVSVPEPVNLAMVATALGAVMFLRRRHAG
jgi:hypothetical protein